MGCPGGCINGGGQPRCTEENYREKRARALYSEDERKVLRKSHENPDLMKLYGEWLGEPNGHLAHHLLHTIMWGEGSITSWWTRKNSKNLGNGDLIR